MKWIKLLSSAYVSGVLRHPHEGVLHLDDNEGKRLLDGGLGSDVSADFTAKQDKETPVESVTVVSGMEPARPADHPHQSELAPAIEDVPAPAKAAGSKE